jgi:periplasmic protein TonB
MKALIISFVTHIVVIGAALLGSVVAPETMPRLMKRISPPILASIVPPHDVQLPPVQPKRAAVKSSSTVTAATVVDIANAAPLVVPNGVAPESGFEAFGSPGAVLGVTDGLGGAKNLETFAPPPPPPDAPKRPLILHAGIAIPRKVVDVAPIYPDLARAIRAQGTVIVEATIDERGNVIAARVLRSVNLLDDAALTAVRQWKFMPARLNGEAVPVLMTVTVNFRLQ